MIRIARYASGFLVLTLALFAHGTARAQAPTPRNDSSMLPPPQVSKSTFGLFGDAALNIDRANFQTLPGIPNCCPLFENGSGLGGSFGAFYDYDAFGDGHLGVRVGISLLDGTLKANEAMTIAVNGQPVIGTIQHSIASQFTTWMIEPYYAMDLGGFRLMLGASAGSIRKSSYNQAETIISPANEGVFVPENTRTRNVISGTPIPDVSSVRVGIVAGASYPLPLNTSGSLHLIPEVLFDYGLTPMVSGLSWSVSALQGGVSIGYTPIHVFRPPPPAPPPPPPPPTPMKPRLTAAIKAYSITNGVKDSTNLSVRVEEYYSTTLTPLLPYVFFGLDSAIIPARYDRITSSDTAGFETRHTDTTTNITVYHNILNIIGKRMQEHPKAQLTLTGCTSNEPVELANKNLGLARADAVAIYLERVWGIAPNRMRLNQRGLPEKPSSLTNPDGKQENRRVEISASDPAILAPVFLPDTTLTSNPPKMEFVPIVSAQAGVKHWDMYVTTAVMTLHHEYGSGTPKGWDWDLRAVSAKIPRTEDSLEYGLSIMDSTGQELTTTGSIPVRQVTIKKKREERRADTVIERYTLVLFNFGSAKIDPKNRRAIEYIHNQLTPGTMAYITGYADRTGEYALNQHLTEDRANNVAKLLGATHYIAKGLGKSVLLFDNNFPEGRFYSRTVNIVLDKPVN